jgi:hypothetical protein
MTRVSTRSTPTPGAETRYTSCGRPVTGPTLTVADGSRSKELTYLDEEYFATELLWALACGCIGIVEYQTDSSAHELIEHRERDFRVTTPQEIADRIVEAAGMDHRTIGESLAEYDHSAVAGQYESLYDRLIDARGLF